jgi:ATP-dependent Clp protease ATP-binding subunit ClpC
LDEIEKAHPDVFNLLLQILDDGRLTDGQGRTVSFKNTVIIMTSNIGAEILQKQGSIGFKKQKEELLYREIKDKLLEEVRRTFKPEFLNRIDEIVIFNPLTKEDINKIVDIELDELQNRLTKHNIVIQVTQKAKEYLAEKGFDVSFGARPLKRLIQKKVVDALSVKILEGKIKSGDKVVVDFKDNAIVFQNHQ